jgi:hypothetical protein
VIVKFGGEWYGSGLFSVASFVISGDEASDCVFRGLILRLALGKQVVRVDREWNCPVGGFDTSDVQPLGLVPKLILISS